MLIGQIIVILNYCERLQDIFGTDVDTVNAISYLRDACDDAGLGDPYIACMVWYGQHNDGANYINNHGYDAITSYAPVSSYGYTGASYATLAAQNVTFWNACKGTGKKVIPSLNVGWDPRPRSDPYWFQQPTPTELKNHVAAAIDWCLDYPGTANANAVLIYALNEYDEGGWLDPNETVNKWRLNTVYDAIHGF